jgi:hypothetical protein
MLRIPRSKPMTSQAAAQQPRTLAAWRGPVTLLIAPGALLATIAFSCHDKDAIWIVPPGGAGAAGEAPGVAGTGGIGNGGMGGSNAAGAAGSSSGGTAGSGAGGSAGSSNGGSAGSGTAGTTGLPGDAGPDSGGPDSGGPPPPLTQQQAADAICARLGEVASCSPPDSCPDAILGGWEGLKGFFPDCTDTIDAYFHCVALEPVTSYDCSGGTSEVSTPQPGNCADEDVAFQAVQGGTDPRCPPPI